MVLLQFRKNCIVSGSGHKTHQLVHGDLLVLGLEPDVTLDPVVLHVPHEELAEVADAPVGLGQEAAQFFLSVSGE